MISKGGIVISSISIRLKKLRDENGLSQSDFGKRIGLSQSQYSKLELGNGVVQDRHIIAICSQFGVNETWLRTGEGDMWQEDDADLLDRMTKKHHLTGRQQAIVQNFLAMPDDRREALLDLLSDILPPREAPAPAEDDELPAEIRRQLADMDAAAQNEKSRDA